MWKVGMACAEERLACRARQRRYGGDKKRMACQLRSAAAPCSGFDRPCSDPPLPNTLLRILPHPPVPETSSDALTDQCDHGWALRSWWQQFHHDLPYDLVQLWSEAPLLCVHLVSLANNYFCLLLIIRVIQNETNQ